MRFLNMPIVGVAIMVFAPVALAQDVPQAWKPAIEQKIEQKTVISNWNYVSSKDEMRGIVRDVAYIISPKLLESSISYRDASTVTLNLGKKDGKTNIWLSIDKGQFICYEMYASEIKAKFDDGKIMDFRCARPMGGSTRIVFIEPEGRFLAALKSSKKLIVELTLFQDGTRQIPFNTAGLIWK